MDAERARRRGRPREHGERIVLGIRMSEQERDRLKAEAKVVGLSLTAYTLHLLRGDRVSGARIAVVGPAAARVVTELASRGIRAESLPASEATGKALAAVLRADATIVAAGGAELDCSTCFIVGAAVSAGRRVVAVGETSLTGVPVIDLDGAEALLGQSA